jgi:peptide/nickel transport system permease protein
MTTFLLRRLAQIFLVVVLSAAVSYGLLYIAPGGPIEGLRAERQQGGADRITPEDIARIKARFELDLALPVRFTRWLIGLPRGPIWIGEQALLADTVVGCAQPGLVRLRYPDGRVEIVEEGCVKPVTLGELEGRRASRGILLGDLGLSQTILRDRPVMTLIWSRLPYTLTLMGVSILLSILIGVPLGVYSAVRQYSRFDTIATAIAFVGSSLPSFVFGVFAILIFAVLPDQAGWPHLPPGNAEANRDYVLPLIGRVEAGSFLDQLFHFILPCAVLTFINIAGWSRFVRASMLEVLQQDYVRTARAKGVRERAVILKHSLRNALLPFITLLAGVLPALFSGAVITESVFNWPGLGRLLIQALAQSDYTVAMALTFVQIVLLLIGYLISDILYSVADPRIRLT